MFVGFGAPVPRPAPSLGSGEAVHRGGDMSSDGSAPGDGPGEERPTPPDRPWVAPSERRADEPLTTTDELPIIPPASTGAEPDLSVRAAPAADGTTRPYPP